MATIKRSFGSGGSNLNPGGGRNPSLALALRDVADDLATLQVGTVTAIATADATDLASAVTLVNACKAKINELITNLNAQDGATLKTVKG